MAERTDVLRKIQAMKRASFDVSDSACGDDPDSAGGGKDQLANVGAGKAFFEAEPQKAAAIEAKEAIGGANPDETFLVLKNAVGGERTEAEVFADGLKSVMRMVRNRKDERLG